MRLALPRSAVCLFAVVLAGVLSGCEGDPALAGTGGSTASGTTSGSTAAPACVCEEKEDCRACYEHIGECCYGDATIFGQIAPLTANCERDGACSSCCNECVKKTCAELIAGNDCPVPVPSRR